MKQTILDEVKNLEKAAAMNERPMERKVLLRQARQARVRHTVTCDMMPGKRLKAVERIVRGWPFC